MAFISLIGTLRSYVKIYKATYKARLIRQRDHLKEQRKYFDEEVEKVRTTLQTQREELVI